MNIIKVGKAHKRYQLKSETNLVLSDFNMNVKTGTIYALMGSSGCGKTTLISCLVGIMKLNSGKIEIFGGSPHQNQSRIGYMPQETALIGEFTIAEMVWFYGTMFGLSSRKIEERLSFLSKLLELPSRNKIVRECSGGQQRRISFALTLVHEPELLILDEPTVGVDPLLRSKIWDYLVDLTSTKKVTVLLSTHYIEEARQSTHIGLMRNGVQIAEDSPGNIMRITETSNLEEAFLKLSNRQELDSSFKVDSCDSATTEYKSKTLANCKSFKKNLKTSAIMKALLTKHVVQIHRNFEFLFIVTIFPIISFISLHYAIGGRISDLKIGIVNNEIDSISECFNKSLQTTNIVNFECKLNKVSCRFINGFDSATAEKKFYKSSHEAFSDVKAGKIIGFVEFSTNFTDSLILFKDEYSDNGIIQVHLDQTDMQKTFLMKTKLFETYIDFAQKLMLDCGKSMKAGNPPIAVEALFGELNFDFKTTISPGFTLASSFSLASYILSTSMISERLSGTWNRSLVAGAKPIHFLLSHLIEGVLIQLIQFVESLIYLNFFLAPTSLTSNGILLISMLLIFNGITGLTFGVLLSIAMNTTMSAFAAAQFLVFPVTYISGIMWPFEALPISFQYIGYMFPFTLPTAAFRNILAKDSDIFDPTVYLAFVTLFTWIVAQVFLSFWLIREKGEKKLKTKNIM